jgi:hypothetical protein
MEAKAHYRGWMGDWSACGVGWVNLTTHRDEVTCESCKRTRWFNGKWTKSEQITLEKLKGLGNKELLYEVIDLMADDFYSHREFRLALYVLEERLADWLNEVPE